MPRPRRAVICGLPDMDLAADKWRLDLLPVIERSKYRDLLPGTGAGSRGARLVETIRFVNCATLKFMSGGGGDTSGAGFSARVGDRRLARRRAHEPRGGQSHAVGSTHPGVRRSQTRLYGVHDVHRAGTHMAPWQRHGLPSRATGGLTPGPWRSPDGWPARRLHPRATPHSCPERGTIRAA